MLFSLASGFQIWPTLGPGHGTTSSDGSQVVFKIVGERVELAVLEYLNRIQTM
jgi:hypothetical protein